MSEPKPIRILYMEDDPGLARLFQKRLERAGYVVDIAHDGEEGLAMYAAGSYDVVAVDQVMPVHTGLEVVSIMAAQGPLPPMIMVTGTGSEQIAVEAMKLGVGDYLVKDVDGGYLNLLPTVIEQVLQQQRLVEGRRQALEALRESEERLRLLVQNMPVMIDALDDDGNFILWNRECERVTGYSADEIIGNPRATELLYPNAHRRESVTAEVAEHAADFRDFEWDIKCRDGSVKTVSWANISDQVPIPGWAQWAIGVDITERKRAEAIIKQMAYHDALTGLPNRRLFNDRLTLALAHAQRSQQKLAVMLFDLDHFKDVNDTLGHGVGDQLLQAVSERLTSLLRKGDTVARMGGDEFMLLLPEIAGGEGAAEVAHKILEAIREPYEFDDHEIHVTTSIGIALYPDAGKDGDTLMKSADIAMYRAKDLGRDNCQRYTLAE